MMSNEAYVFVDGAYLRKAADALMQSLYDKPAELNYLAIRHATSGASRVFYYDCLNDQQIDGESKDAFETRVAAQQALFDSIQHLQGFHVRLGSLSGKRRRLRQKKVDVLLAVEALDHAFRKNMDRVCLITGDLDFAPLVDSLIRLGVYVEIRYEARSASRELYSTADVAWPITVDDIYNWSTTEFRGQHPMPNRTAGQGVPPSPVLRKGTINGKHVQLHSRPGFSIAYLPEWNGNSLNIECSDFKLMERYIEIVYGKLEWNA